MDDVTYSVSDAGKLARFDRSQPIDLGLFDDDAFHGRLLCLDANQSIGVHIHAHKDEVFDVVRGEGTIIVGDQRIAAGPGVCVFVPAGVPHGLRSHAETWVLRETVYERVYFRRSLTLLGKALRKRLKRLGK